MIVFGLYTVFVIKHLDWVNLILGWLWLLLPAEKSLVQTGSAKS